MRNEGSPKPISRVGVILTNRPATRGRAVKAVTTQVPTQNQPLRVNSLHTCHEINFETIIRLVEAHDAELL
jgi:hypothetical protein